MVAQLTMDWGGGHVDSCSLLQYIEANRDGDPRDIQDAKRLEIGESFKTGGGAFATCTITRIS